jgi:hypothetical protein
VAVAEPLLEHLMWVETVVAATVVAPISPGEMEPLILAVAVVVAEIHLEMAEQAAPA